MTPLSRYLTISATVFAVVAVAHIARAIAQWPIQIGPIAVPVELSWPAGIATAALSIWGFLHLRDR
jgi:hypothetical protein